MDGGHDLPGCLPRSRRPHARAVSRQHRLGHACEEQRVEQRHISTLRARRQVKLVRVRQQGEPCTQSSPLSAAFSATPAPVRCRGRCGRPQCASRPRSGGQSPSLALLECVSKEQADVRAEALREVVRLVKGRPRLASARATYTTTWADYSPPFSRLGGTEAITELPDVCRRCTARGPRQTRGSPSSESLHKH